MWDIDRTSVSLTLDQIVDNGLSCIGLRALLGSSIAGQSGRSGMTPKGATPSHTSSALSGNHIESASTKFLSWDEDRRADPTQQSDTAGVSVTAFWCSA